MPEIRARPSSQPPDFVSARRRFALLALLAGLAGAAWYSGAFRTFSDIDKVRSLLGSWEPWSYVIFFGTFSFLQPLGVPAIFWVLPAAILWPFGIAFPLSLAGALGAASVGFLFARYLARDWVAARLPDRLRRVDERLLARGLAAVILIRLVFHLIPPTHWLLGLSNVRYGAYALGTVLGSVPNIALVTYFGVQALRWVETHSSMAWAILAAVLLIGLVARRVWLARRRSKGPDR